MAVAVINVEDDGNGQIDISIDFGEGSVDESHAHQAAVTMLRLYTEYIASFSEDN